MTDYKIKESGQIILNDVKILKTSHGQIAQNNELKKHLNIGIFNKAKEKIKQEIIASDKSPDNSVVYAAISNFKKTNE